VTSLDLDEPNAPDQADEQDEQDEQRDERDRQTDRERVEQKQALRETTRTPTGKTHEFKIRSDRNQQTGETETRASQGNSKRQSRKRPKPIAETGHRDPIR
jgi:hypothetical protein